jgi:lactate dehydrogenase-like 2-hydroxyacid dehydrogenase
MDGKVLVTGTSVEARFLEPLIAVGLEISNPTHLLSERELADELSDAVAYLLGGDEIATAVALENASLLRIIAFLGVGYESFMDVAAATRRGIVITNTPGTLTDSVAEFTIGHLLDARRRITLYTNAYRAGRSGTEEKQFDLQGHTFGIIGLGAIGTRIAEILRIGFRAEVCYFSRTRKPQEEDRLGITYCDLQSLFRSVEGIIVMVPGNDSTRNMIDSALLSSAKPGTLLINTARTEVVEPGALRGALESGVVETASFDGFYEGEVGEALLRDFGEDRLLVTGHIGSLTHDARDAMARRAVQSILNVLEAGTDPYIVNQAALTG